MGASIPVIALEASACPLCSGHGGDEAADSAAYGDVAVRWAVVLTSAVLAAIVSVEVERWFGLGAVTAVAAAAVYACIGVRAALRRSGAAHARELAKLSEDADSRVATVIREFEWAVNDVVKLKRDLERAEAGADLLVGQARQRERYVRKLEAQLIEARERLVAIGEAARPTPARAEFDPLADAMAGVVPFSWSLHNDRYQVNLELECGVTSHRPTRVRLVDRDGDVVIMSGTAMWTEEGRVAFTLANPPVDLVLDLDAGREITYSFEALAEYEWRPVRLEDSGRRTKVVTDKAGRLYRVSDEPDAAQLLAPTLPLN